MAKGRFEADKNGGRPAWNADPFAVKDKPEDVLERRNWWPILAVAVGVVALVVGLVLLLNMGGKTPTATTQADTTASETLRGMTRSELEQKANEISILLNRDVVLTLVPQTGEEETADSPTESEEASIRRSNEMKPIEVRLSRNETGVNVDYARLNADLDAGVGKESEDTYLLDLTEYLSIDENALQIAADRVAEEYGGEGEPATVTLEDLSGNPTEEEDEKQDEDTPADRQLVIRLGTTGRDIRAEDIFNLLKSNYLKLFTSENPKELLQPTLNYRIHLPEQSVDVDALWARYCKDPVEPTVERSTGEVVDGKNGYGFDREDLMERLSKAKPGEEIKVRLTILQPKTDTKTLRENLFKDVLAEAHTNHTAIWNRTTNLKLAAEAVNGTILLPGEVFSFNKVVGERTEEKGYKEAIAYVHGGESKPELGGGVCQVASSIYYAVLLADLKTVEREPHMYLVDYVPSGMDATIYWGYLDYKFENNSPYPIKIEASVHDGQVHVILYGTEWKDYTVKLSYEVLETEPWEEVQQDVAKDGTYYEGEVITTPYTGYKIATYKTTYDKDGKKLERTQIGISRYKKRDKVIAHLVDSIEPTKPTTQPTKPTTQPTTPPTQPTTPPTKPTTPPTQPTTPPTQPTTPPTQPTTPPTQPTTPPTEPTTPPTEPTTPPTETTQPTTPPTEPPQPSSEPEPPQPSSETEPPPQPSSETAPPEPSESDEG